MLIALGVVVVMGVVVLSYNLRAVAHSENGGPRQKAPEIKETLDRDHSHEDHQEEKSNEQSHEEGHGEDSSHDHEEGDSHGHDEGENSNVGPNKGITEADEALGFKLSREAVKNFDLKFNRLSGQGPWTILNSARVTSGEEVNLYRLRDGYFKRIDFAVLKAGSATFLIRSQDLREGDEIVFSGVGFLRIAELAAFGGVADGHSH